MAYNLLRHQIVIALIKILFGREPVSLVNELVSFSASLLKMALPLFNGILWKFML